MDTSQQVRQRMRELAMQRQQMDSFLQDRNAVSAPSSPMTVDDAAGEPAVPQAVETAARDVSRRGGDPRPNLDARSNTQAFHERNLRNAGIRASLPESPESGTLPGEEQITSRDVLRTLNTQEQAALQAKYDGGGHSNSMSYDDWLSTHFGDVPPTERSAAMRAVAGDTPRVSIGVDPNLPVGRNSELAKSRLAANKPLPEGREPKQYGKDQTREMARNVHSPEVPMTRFGGTFTHNVDGSKSSRAPNPAMLQQAAAIAADQGEGSPSHIATLAQAYGIDAIKYGDDLDMLRADTLREHQRHQTLGGKYRIVSTGMGGFRYTPNDQMKAQQDAMRLRQMHSTIGARAARYGMIDDPVLAGRLDNALHTPDGKAQLVALNQEMRAKDARNRAANYRDRVENYNMTRDLQNPALSPGMGVRSLIQAVRAGNPEMAAVVYDAFGNPTAAGQSRQLAGVQARAAGDAQAAQIEAANDLAIAQMRSQKDAETPDPMLGDQANQQVARIFAIENPTVRRQAAEKYMVESRKDLPLELQKVEALKMIASHGATINGVQDPFVREYLDLLKNNKPAFLLFAETQLKLTPEQAKQLYDSGAQKPFSVRAGRAVGSAPAAIAGGLSGAAQGFREGLRGQ